MQRMRAVVPGLNVIGGAIGRDANDLNTASTLSRADLYCKENIHQSGAVGCLLTRPAKVMHSPRRLIKVISMQRGEK